MASSTPDEVRLYVLLSSLSRTHDPMRHGCKKGAHQSCPPWFLAGAEVILSPVRAEKLLLASQTHHRIDRLSLSTITSLNDF